jgi:hypothetical protein
MLLQGLINIIPIVGQMALFGWMYGSLDNLRQGRQELQGAGFGNLGRGAVLWVVDLIYTFVIIVVYVVLLALGGRLGNQGGAASAGGAFFALLAVLWEIVAGFALSLLFPTIALFTDRGGFGRGLNIVAVIQTASANAGVALLAGLFSLIASFIAGFGVIICFIGLYFTATWVAGVTAGLLFWMERSLPGAGGMMPQQQPPPSQPYMQPPPPPAPPSA